MNSKYLKQDDIYKPQHLQLIGLALKAGRYKPIMLKWFLVIIGIILFGVGIAVNVGQQLRIKNPELVNSIKQMGVIFGLAEPSSQTGSGKEESSILLKEEKLHELDGVARLYLKFSGNSKETETKSDKPWVLQGLVDDVLIDPENRKNVKQWVKSLKQKTPVDEP